MATFGDKRRLPATGTSVATNPVTDSFTLPAGTGVLWVGITRSVTNTRVGAPTFNSVALTQSDQNREAPTNPEEIVEAWYLLNPGTGSAYTLSIPNPNTLAMGVEIAWASPDSGYSFALEDAQGVGGNSTNPVDTVAVAAAGGICFGMVGNGANSFAPTAWSQTEIHTWDMGTFGGGAMYAIPAGSGTITFQWNAATDDWAVTVVAFSQVEGVTPINVTDAGDAWTSADGILGQHNYRAGLSEDLSV